ncbi:MAG TPA: NAD(P)/FAD-dependent oxidoreductase [Coleofasciculaceae cyanobacterium]
MVKKIAIVGAGPSGVLLAHYLLRRGDRYQVDLYERLNDPRTTPFSTSRTYPISLNERGMNALSQIPGLQEAIGAIGLEMWGTLFHQTNGKTRTTSRTKPLMTLDRTRLVMLLLDQLSQTYDASRLNLHFNCPCTQVDFATKTICFQTEAAAVTAEYDLLVGADGARSVVRGQFLNTELFEFEQKYTPTDYKSIILPRSDRQSAVDLEVGKIHSWRIKDGTVVVLLHQPDGAMSGVILFPRHQNQVASLATPQAVRTFFLRHFPEVEQRMPESEVEAFLQRPTSRILTIRCSHYHYRDSVLLIGDAAHSVSPSIGQGCNAALEDVVIFDTLLDECVDDLGAAIEQFTLRRKADAHALVELGDYAFPATTGLFIEFVFRQRFADLLHRRFPHRFAPSLATLVFETSVPYSEILQSHQGWISKVKRSNEKSLSAGRRKNHRGS